MRRFALALSTLLSLLLLACSSSEPSAAPESGASANVTPATAPAQPTTVPPAPSPTTPPAATPSPPPAATPSPRGVACTAFPPGVAAGSTVVRTTTSGTIPRSYRLHIPPNLKVSDRAPLVLNFHGLGSNALEQEFYSGLVAVSDREGFILVSPDGTGATRGWASFRTVSTGVDDVLFTRDLLGTLTADLCIDAKRVYSTGFSNGAFQSSLLACVLSDRIAAVAPVAGARYPADETCGRAVPMLAIHGTADPTVPFEPGLILGVLPWDGVRKNVDGWRAKNGCSGATEERLGEHVTREVGQGCTAPVDFIVVRDGGHTWPGAIDIPALGVTTREVAAAELIWAFFKTQTLP